MINVYITCKDKKEAKKITNMLLNKRLIACSNIFPIKSIYWWKGNVAKEKEYAVIVKSIKALFDEIVKEIKKMHSYECPCIEMMPVKANEEYEKWLNGEINQNR